MTTMFLAEIPAWSLAGTSGHLRGRAGRREHGTTHPATTVAGTQLSGGSELGAEPFQRGPHALTVGLGPAGGDATGEDPAQPVGRPGTPVLPVLGHLATAVHCDEPVPPSRHRKAEGRHVEGVLLSGLGGDDAAGGEP